MNTKNTSVKIITILLALGFCLTVPAGRLSAAHSVFLTTVPQYTQEAFTWCGPATAQMVMEGYPSGGCTELQEDIWLAILAARTEACWDTDPAGMKGAMTSMCPPSGTWQIVSDTDSQDLVYSVAYWMTKNSYPVALLMNTDAHSSFVPGHMEHWVAVSGIVTDKDPTTNSSVTLQGILIHDPAHADLGYPSVQRYCSGATWSTLFKAVNKPASSYNGKFLAVIEPPRRRGIAVMPKEVIRGVIIKPDIAIKNATRFLREYNLLEIEAFRKLEKAVPQRPWLVNRKLGGYYLVPFSLGEKGLVCGAVLINAYTGELKEAGVFKPVRYIQPQKAKLVAQKYLKTRKVRRIRVELVTRAGDRAFSPYFPTWKITVDRKVVHIDQKGKIFSRILPVKVKKSPSPVRQRR